MYLMVLLMIRKDKFKWKLIKFTESFNYSFVHFIIYTRKVPKSIN